MERDFHTPGRCDACGRKVEDPDQYICDDCDAAMYEAYHDGAEANPAVEEEAA